MTVEQRLETIERSLRRWRKAAITLCALLVVAGTMAASRQEEIPDVIKTRSLQVVNKDGEVVVAAHAQKNGAGILQVFHEPGDSPGVEIPHYMNVGRIECRDDEPGAITVLSAGKVTVRRPDKKANAIGEIRLTTDDGVAILDMIAGPTDNPRANRATFFLPPQSDGGLLIRHPGGKQTRLPAK